MEPMDPRLDATRPTVSGMDETMEMPLTRPL